MSARNGQWVRKIWRMIMEVTPCISSTIYPSVSSVSFASSTVIKIQYLLYCGEQGGQTDCIFIVLFKADKYIQHLYLTLLLSGPIGLITCTQDNIPRDDRCSCARSVFNPSSGLALKRRFLVSSQRGDSLTDDFSSRDQLHAFVRSRACFAVTLIRATGSGTSAVKSAVSRSALGVACQVTSLDAQDVWWTNARDVT